MRGTVLLLAAGRGERLRRGPKAFVELAGVSLLRRAAEAALEAALVDGLVAAVPPEDVGRAGEALEGLGACVVPGGRTRQASAAAALEAASGAEAVAVHDAARCLCPPAVFDRVLAALDESPAALAAWPVTDTIKEADGDLVARTLDRTRLVAAQTPQAFRADVFREAHQAAAREGVDATDDVALVERLGVPVRIVPGDEWNLKVTTEVDLEVAEALLRRAGR